MSELEQGAPQEPEKQDGPAQPSQRPPIVYGAVDKEDLDDLRAHFGSAEQRRAEYDEPTDEGGAGASPNEDSSKTRREGYEEIPKKATPPQGPSFFARIKSRLRALAELWNDETHDFTSYNHPDDSDEVNEERTASQKRVALLIFISLLLGAGLTSPLVFYVGPALIAAVGVSLGISTLGVGFLAMGIGALLMTAIMAAVENIERGKFTDGDYVHTQRQTYLRRTIFATLMLAGIGIGIFLAGTFPAVLSVFASVAGPGLIALTLAGAAGLVALGLLTSLIYAAVVIQYERTAKEFKDEKSLLQIISRHPVLFRVLLGALIAAGVGALMILVFPGALAAFAVAVGLTAGSPLALIAAVGTVMLLSAAFGLSLLGFLEMRLIEASKKISALQVALIIIPAAIAGATLGIFLGVTALPILTFGLSGPAALAVAGAIGLAVSIMLAAVALGGIYNYQKRKPKKASEPKSDTEEPAVEEEKQESSKGLLEVTEVLSTSMKGLWERRIFRENWTDENGTQYKIGSAFYYNTDSNGENLRDKPDGYDEHIDPKPASPFAPDIPSILRGKATRLSHANGILELKLTETVKLDIGDGDQNIQELKSGTTVYYNSSGGIYSTVSPADYAGVRIEAGGKRRYSAPGLSTALGGESKQQSRRHLKRSASVGEIRATLELKAFGSGGSDPKKEELEPESHSAHSAPVISQPSSKDEKAKPIPKQPECQKDRALNNDTWVRITYPKGGRVNGEDLQPGAECYFNEQTMELTKTAPSEIEFPEKPAANAAPKS